MIFSFVAPLDLQTILVSNFAGSMQLFGLIALIAIIMLTAYFRMNGYTALIMIGVFTIMFADYLEGIWVLVILFAAIAFTWQIRGIVTK